jgi:hypothetical protein
MSDLSPAEREAMLRVHLTRGKGVYHRERVWLAARDYYAAEHAEDIVSMASARDVGAFKGGQKQSEDRIRVLEARLVSCEPRGECPVCGGERDHMDACEVGALSSRIRVLEEALKKLVMLRKQGQISGADATVAWSNARGVLSTSVGSSDAEANSDAGKLDAPLKRYELREVEAMLKEAHEHGRSVQRAIEHGEIDSDDADSLPLTIETASRRAREFMLGLDRGEHHG